MGAYNRKPELDGTEGTSRRRGRRTWIRAIAWVAASMVVLVLAAGVAIVALVNTDAVHRYLIGLAQSEASEALGVQVKLENFTLHLPALSLDLYGIRVSGASPYPDPPLLQADHVEVGIRVVSVFRRAWYLDRLQVDRPVAWVVVDKNGVTNLPELKGSGSNHTSVFDLGIRHAVLARGEVYLNDRPSLLAADLHDLEFRASFDSARTMYSGNLAYTGGQLEYGSFRPLQHNSDAEFRATPNTFQLTRAQITSGQSEAIVSAVLDNYRNPAIQAKYDVVVDGRQLGQLLDEPLMPAGLIRTTGSLEYRHSPDRSTIQMLTVNGELASSRLAINASAAHAEVRNLVAHYSLANSNATLHDLRANVFGGEMTAQGTTQAIGENSHSSYRAELDGISLAAMRSALGSSASPNDIALTGKANATATATWGRTIDDLVAHADATLNGEAQRSHTPAEQTVAATIPLDGAIHATYQNNGNELKIDNSYLRTSQTNINLNGTVSRHSSLSVQLQANDLREVAAIVDLFRASGNAQLDLTGRASFQGTVQGSTASPHLTGQLSAENLHLNGADWKTLRTVVDLSPSRAAFENVDLESAPRGRITGSASAGLQKWSFSRQSAIQADLNASQIDMATIAKLSGQQIPVSGTLDAKINLHGDVMNPAGAGNVTLTRVTAYEQPITSAKLDFTGSGNQAQANLCVQLPAGTIERSGRSPATTTNIYRPTELQRHRPRKVTSSRRCGISMPKALLTMQAQARGTFDNPEINADLQIPSLAIEGHNFLRYQAADECRKPHCEC